MAVLWVVRRVEPAAQFKRRPRVAEAKDRVLAIAGEVPEVTGTS
jgi:hypothetical protein